MKRFIVIFVVVLIAMIAGAQSGAQAIDTEHQSAAALTTSTATCEVVSCTVFLPVIMKPLPTIPPQFEVTQGVQQPDNSVLLVANRPTYVRWTLTSTNGETDVNAYLVAARDGVALAGSPLPAFNNPRTLNSASNRAVLNDTFNFQLPAAWTSDSVSLSAYASSSTGFSTTTTAQAFQFNATDDMAVRVVPIAYHCTSGGSGTTTPAGPYDYLIDYTYRIYPVPAIPLSVHAAVPYDGPCNSSGVPLPYDPNNPTDAYWGDMLDTITSVWQSEGSPDIYYYGLVKVDCSHGCISGIGWIGGLKAAVGFDGFANHSGASETHAHELGHNHGRRHSPGCGAAGVGSFPYVPADGKARIGDATHPNFGFDLNSRAIYTYDNLNPTYYDIMNYCDPQWVSDYTYEAWWTYDNSLRISQADQTSGARAFLISGSIDPETKRVAFQPAYAIDLPAWLPQRGDYTLELLDIQDRVLAAYPFAPIAAQPDRWRDASTEEISGFHVTVPYLEGVSALQVRRGTAILGTLRPGTRSPSVSAAEIRSGQLSWTSRDIDRDALHYLVRASTDDGRTWQTVGLNLAEPSVNLTWLDSRGHRLLVQILASDGLNTTTVQLGPFQTPNQ
jgi:hypothetical protein